MARTNSDATSLLWIPLEDTAPTDGQMYIYNATTMEWELGWWWTWTFINWDWATVTVLSES